MVATCSSQKTRRVLLGDMIAEAVDAVDLDLRSVVLTRLYVVDLPLADAHLAL